MRNDDATETTMETMDTESFVQVQGGNPLTMTAAPRYASIGVDAIDPTPPAAAPTNNGSRRGGFLFGGGSNRSSGASNGTTTAKVMTTTDFCVTMTAGELPESEEARAPVDILVALDKSGSMASRGKLDLCQKTLQVLLRQLLPHDRFGLITYSHDARIAVPIRKLTPAHRQSAQQTIRELRAGGGTNMSSAVGLAAQELRMVDGQPNPIQTVFFLTDGHANSGISDVQGLRNLVHNCFVEGGNGTDEQTVSVEFPPSFQFGQQQQHQQYQMPPQQQYQMPQQQQYQMPPPHPYQNNNNNVDNTAQVLQSLGVPRQAAERAAMQKEAPATAAATGDKKEKTKPKSPISLHTFGYGAGHNGTLLREMAAATEGGSYYFIEEDKDVGSAFGDALGGVLSVVAQNATVTLDVPVTAKAMGVEITHVHHDQAIRRDNGSYTVTVGDFYSEETRDLVVSIKLATPPPTPEQHAISGDPIPHATARLAYTDTLASRPVQSDMVVVSIARPVGSNELSEENPHVAAQRFRVYAAKEMEEAEQMASAGRYDEAKTKFATMQVAYQQCSPAVQQMPGSTEVFADACEMERTLEDVNLYRTKGQATLNSKMYAHKKQRAAVSSAAPAVAAMSAMSGGSSRGGSAPMAYKQNKKRADYASKFSTH